MPPQPIYHRCHDYAFLMQRWKALAKSAGLSMKAFVKVGEFSVYRLFSRAAVRSRTRPAIYLSAGVHGDEPAAPWGLLEWAESHAALFDSIPFLFYPCLNPYGLTNNLRRDERGVDINRAFHLGEDPVIAAWRKSLENRKLAAGFQLHEDYDATGIYLYELNAGESVGRLILRDASKIIPEDQRPKIEGRMAEGGLIHRRNVPPDLPGMPETIAIFDLGAPVAMTFESPSEFSLTERVNVQKQFIQSALHHVCGL